MQMPLRRDGALVAPSSGTVTIQDSNGDDIITGGVVVVASSIATYSLAAAAIPATLEFSDFWREIWTLVVAGESRTFERSAALVREDIVPVVSVSDIRSRHTDLDAAFTDAEVQGRLDAAWDDVNAHLLAQGRKPYRILSAYDLREPHRCRAFELCFLDMWTSASGGKYRALAKVYADKCARAWDLLTVDYDANDDGITSPSETGQSGSALLFTGGVGSWTR